MSTGTTLIPLLYIDAPATDHRVDRDDGYIHELAESIRRIGLINPITVRPDGNDQYILVAGLCRYKAHLLLDRAEIECIVLDDLLSDPNAIQFAENLIRRDLSPMEEARAINIELTQSGQTSAELASRIGKSVWWIEERMKLNNFPLDLTERIHTRELSVAVAHALARVDDDEHRARLLLYAVTSGASATVVRAWADEYEIHRNSQAAGPIPEPSPLIPGQPVIIQIPCWVCSEPTPHTDAVIIRICPTCAQARQA